jgi:hypothetical protein
MEPLLARFGTFGAALLIVEGVKAVSEVLPQNESKR